MLDAPLLKVTYCSFLQASPFGFMTLDPPEDQWNSLNTLIKVAEWANLPGEAGDKATPRGSLFHLLGADGSEAPRVIAMLSVPDFDKLLSQWRISMSGGGAPATVAPTAIQLGQGALFGRTCRAVTGMLKPPPQAPVLSTPALDLTNSSDKRRVKLSSVINQIDDFEIDILDENTIQAAYARYSTRFGAFPHPDHELSTEQLSTLHSLFTSGRAPYTDMAIWGPYHKRLQKKIRLKGVKLNAQGEITPVEMNGPADFESWRESYAVFKTGAIMFDQISPARLEAYEHRIRSYHERYGRECWALIYQADVRARLEQTERLRRIGADELEAATKAGGTHSFDKKKPWEWVWDKLVHDQAFWHQELEEPALLILSKSAKVPQLVDDDAAVEGRASPPGGPGAGRGLKRKRSDGQRQHMVGDDGLLTHNRKGVELCRGFQKGTCKEKDKHGFCIKTGRTRHQCAKCLSEDHGADVCPKDAPSQPRVFKPKGGGRKGGKSKA